MKLFVRRSEQISENENVCCPAVWAYDVAEITTNLGTANFNAFFLIFEKE
jgi:hypothetical protein